MPDRVEKSIISLISDIGSRTSIPLLFLGTVFFIFCIALFRKGSRRVFGYLINQDGRRFALYSENLLGNKSSSDIRLTKDKTQKFGLIKAYRNGTFSFINLKGSFKIGKKNITDRVLLKSGDRIRAGEESFTFDALSNDETKETGSEKAALFIRLAALVLVTSLNIICFVYEYRVHESGNVIVSFAVLTADIWLYAAGCVVLKMLPSPGVIAAFLLCVLNLVVTAAYNPAALYIQALCITVGLIGYFTFMLLLKKEKFQLSVRIAAMSAGAVLLVLNVLNSGTLLGARNWLEIGGISFQPSELAKVSLVLAGTDTLKGSQSRMNRLLYMAYAAFCVICLAAISDYGTALIFFAAFLTELWIVSGFSDVLLSVAAAAAGCGLVALMKSNAVSYVIGRIVNCGTAWDNPLTSGFQQTRAMIASASGGFFGSGIGEGWLGNVFASGSDMPFAIVWEETGLITAFAAALSVTLVVWSAFRAAYYCGSAFHSICACGAGTIFSLQTILNIGGTMDLIPFTGVTFPFLSSGGSSMISCWLLLALIVSADNMAFTGKAKVKEAKL